MLNKVGIWIISIIYILNMMYIILGNIIRLWCWLTCKKTEPTCNNENCRHRYLCEKYEEPCTQDDLDSLAELIELYKTKIITPGDK